MAPLTQSEPQTNDVSLPSTMALLYLARAKATRAGAVSARW